MVFWSNCICENVSILVVYLKCGTKESVEIKFSLKIMNYYNFDK